MEPSQAFVLLELLAMKGDHNYSTYPNAYGVEIMNEFYTDDGWSCNFLHESLGSSSATSITDHPMPMAADFSIPQMEPFFDHLPFNEVYGTLDVSSFDAPASTSVADHITASNNIMPQVVLQDQYVAPMMDEKLFFLSTNGIQHMEEDKYAASGCKLETLLCPTENQGGDKSVVVTGDQRRRNGVKKVGGQPSKNLMAERRRRKRLNDRLSMLRSIVPRISKMDRTSILADTIVYMKELREKIAKLEEKETAAADVIKNLKELKSNEIQTTKHSPMVYCHLLLCLSDKEMTQMPPCKGFNFKGMSVSSR